jgi:Domain of unknown function (DUF3560)
MTTPRADSPSTVLPATCPKVFKLTFLRSNMTPTFISWTKPKGLTDEQRIELGQLAELPGREAFWMLSMKASRLSPVTGSNHTPCNCSPTFLRHEQFESERAAKAARFRQLAEKHANIATRRHFAARERLELIPLGQPILVGHHSEKRHRRDLKRIDEHFAKRRHTIRNGTDPEPDGDILCFVYPIMIWLPRSKRLLAGPNR